MSLGEALEFILGNAIASIISFPSEEVLFVGTLEEIRLNDEFLSLELDHIELRYNQSIIINVKEANE